MNPKELGNLGEKIAQDYLKKKKYRILAQNFKRKWGEIDIVAKKQGKIIFVEVKTISKKYGFSPEDEIDRK
jgi:putative endonuclease